MEQQLKVSLPAGRPHGAPDWKTAASACRQADRFRR